MGNDAGNSATVVSNEPLPDEVGDTADVVTDASPDASANAAADAPVADARVADAAAADADVVKQRQQPKKKKRR